MSDKMKTHQFIAYIWYIDGIERYVGWGSDVERPFAHLKKGGNKFRNTLRKRVKDGIPCELIILPMDSADEAKATEILWITVIGREDLGTGTLFNLTNGGDGLVNPSIETRRKIGEASSSRVVSAETRAKNAVAASKIVHPPRSLEARKKIGDKKRNIPLSLEHRKNIGLGSVGRIMPPCSEEMRKNISKAKKGKKQTPEQIRKSALARTGLKRDPKAVAATAAKNTGQKRPIVACPHCGRQGGKGAFNRFHFDKCKSLINEQ